MLDRLPDQFLNLVAEETPRFDIGVLYGAVGSNHDHGRWRQLDRQAK